MSGERVERRLAAVLAATVEDYGRLMRTDEEAVLIRLKAIRQTFVAPAIESHRGRIVKTSGDAMLGEFASSVDAAHSAVEVQRAMAAQNSGKAKEAKIEFRIGMHVGDIMIDENDIFGDCVNIAVRLQGLVDPGGICLSDDAHQQVRGKFELICQDLGPQQLKNIAEPIRVWRACFGDDKRFTREGAAQIPSPSLAPEPALELPAKPSVAVLPFANLSGDPAQDYFADGMTDELITELARIPALRVVSRTSVMQVRDKGIHKSLQQIAGALNVDALVEGSVVRSGDKVRITAQLIDARSDKHLWAQSFESETSDILSLQDSVAREIASQTKTVLTPPARGDRNTKPINPAAYDAYLRGRYFLSKRDAVKSAAYFQQAISLDASYASAYAGLADSFETQSVFGDVKTQDGMPKALAAAKRAIELDPENGEAYVALGAIETSYEWNWTAAERDLTHAIALSPSYSYAELRYAIFLDATGRPEDAVTHMRRALELDPLSFYMNRQLGTTLYLARHYDEALSYLRRAGEMEPNLAGIVENWVSAIYEKEGRQDDAVAHELVALGGDHPQIEIERLRSIYQHAGWKAYWQARIDMIAPDADRDPSAPCALGGNYLRLGDRDLAFSWFNRAVDQRCWCMTLLKVDPLLDDIRTDRRYHDLLRRLNLSE